MVAYLRHLIIANQMGQLHARPELHPSGALRSHKGVGYEVDGTTVCWSLFQRIADGLEPPGGEVPRLLFQDEHVAVFVPMVRCELREVSSLR